MYRPRVIPVLLLKEDALYKSIKFKKHKYIGDPINAVRVYNEYHADELVFLDIEATKKNKVISTELIKSIGEEANMPFAVGGGIKSMVDIERIIKSGAEKVIIGGEACNNPSFIKEASNAFGSSTIGVCIDIKKNFLGKKKVCKENSRTITKYNPKDFIKLMEDNGAGELIVQSVDLDGSMKGYDTDLLRELSNNTTLPVVALGGAGSLNHMQEAVQFTHLNGLAAGSMFVYHGRQKGILLSYPEKYEIDSVFGIYR